MPDLQKSLQREAKYLELLRSKLAIMQSDEPYAEQQVMVIDRKLAQLDLEAQIEAKQIYVDDFTRRVQQHKEYQDRITLLYQQEGKETLKKAERLISDRKLINRNPSLANQVYELCQRFRTGAHHSQEEKNEDFLTLKQALKQAANGS